MNAGQAGNGVGRDGTGDHGELAGAWGLGPGLVLRPGLGYCRGLGDGCRHGGGEKMGRRDNRKSESYDGQLELRGLELDDGLAGPGNGDGSKRECESECESE